MSSTGKSRGTESRWVAAKGWEEGGNGRDCFMDKNGFIVEWWNTVELERSGGGTK